MSTGAELAVRFARAADWPAVAALLERTDLPLAGAREHLSTFLLAWRGDTLIACVGAELYGSDALLRSVAVALAGDFAAADRVELDLPETGVCGVSFAADEAEALAAACGPSCVPAPKPSIRIPVRAATACCG
jgi:hypothetical protein